MSRLIHRISPFLIIAVILIQSGIAEAKAEWPPQLGERYPEIRMIDQTGKHVIVSDFEGSVILIEYIGMTCPACQAFSGAHRLGPFKKITPQHDLKSIEEYLPEYAGIKLSDERLVFIQIILYDMKMKAPIPKDAKEWARNFEFDRSKNRIVLAGTKEYVNSASYNLIPGFQVIDKNFILRSDSTGHNPHDNLFSTLLPMIPKLFKESSS